MWNGIHTPTLLICVENHKNNQIEFNISKFKLIVKDDTLTVWNANQEAVMIFPNESIKLKIIFNEGEFEFKHVERINGTTIVYTNPLEVYIEFPEIKCLEERIKIPNMKYRFPLRIEDIEYLQK